MKKRRKKSLNPFRVEFPDGVQTVKGKLAYYLQWHVYLMDTGRGQVVGKVTEVFTEVGFLLLLLDKLGYTQLQVWWIIGIAAVVGVIGVWWLGWLYQYLGLDKTRNMVVRNRDPWFMEQLRILRCKNNGK